MQEVYKAIGRVASEDVPLLVQGEPGTGKLSLVAATHRRMRATIPMVTVDCRVSVPAPTARFRKAT